MYFNFVWKYIRNHSVFIIFSVWHSVFVQSLFNVLACEGSIISSIFWFINLRWFGSRLKNRCKLSSWSDPVTGARWSDFMWTRMNLKVLLLFRNFVWLSILWFYYKTDCILCLSSQLAVSLCWVRRMPEPVKNIINKRTIRTFWINYWILVR